jgi:hypothetical protein
MFGLSRNSGRHISGAISIQKRFLELQAIERAIGVRAANQFLESMELSNKYIDTPLISVSDPANIASWEWTTGLDRYFCVTTYS